VSWLEKLFRPAGTEVSTKTLQPRPDAHQRAADTNRRDDATKSPGTARETRSALDEAGAFLLGVLAMGPRLSKEVRAEAKVRGIAWATIRRAMPKVGVQKQKAGFQGRWVLELQTCSGKSKDAHGSIVSTFGARADEVEEAPARGQRDSDLSCDAHTPARPEPDDVLVPPGFTIPPGVECIRWDLKSAPLKFSRGGTVFNVDDFVERHLEVLAAKLRGKESWLYEQWTLFRRV